MSGQQRHSVQLFRPRRFFLINNKETHGLNRAKMHTERHIFPFVKVLHLTRKRKQKSKTSICLLSTKALACNMKALGGNLSTHSCGLLVGVGGAPHSRMRAPSQLPCHARGSERFLTPEGWGPSESASVLWSVTPTQPPNISCKPTKCQMLFPLNR